MKEHIKNYTDGPWDVVRAGASIMIYGPVGQRVCKLLFPELLRERELNAYLIAAAPDLLEALENLQTQIQQVSDGDRPYTGFDTGLIDAAIARAYGETHHET